MDYVKRALAHAYHGKMSVFKLNKVWLNSKSTFQKTLVYDNIPCLLTSLVTNRSVPRDIGKNKNYISTSKVRKVFLSTDFEVEIGSYIEILQDGKLYSFDYSGEIFHYQTHQEIILETEDLV